MEHDLLIIRGVLSEQPSHIIWCLQCYIYYQSWAHPESIKKLLEEVSQLIIAPPAIKRHHIPLFQNAEKKIWNWVESFLPSASSPPRLSDDYSSISTLLLTWRYSEKTLNLWSSECLYNFDSTHLLLPSVWLQSLCSVCTHIKIYIWNDSEVTW